MSPALPPGRLVVAAGLFGAIRPGGVYIFLHDHKEKIKRAERVSKKKVFFIGDNLSFSTDSRQFGWIDKNRVIAKVFWPRVHYH